MVHLRSRPSRPHKLQSRRSTLPSAGFVSFIRLFGSTVSAQTRRIQTAQSRFEVSSRHVEQHQYDVGPDQDKQHRDDRKHDLSYNPEQSHADRGHIRAH